MKFVNENWFTEMKQALKMKPKFVKHAENIKNEIAAKYDSPLEDITFIGIHNRRTVSNWSGQFLAVSS